MDRRLLAVSGVAVALAGASLYSGPVFRTALVADLGWSNSLAAGAYAVGYVAAGLTPVLGGIAADRFGARNVLIAGLVLSGLGLLGAAFTTVPWQWYATAGLALGVAYYLVHIASTLAATQGPARGTTVGIAVGLGVGVGLGLGPVLAQMAVDAEGWRTALELFGIAVLAGASGVALVVRSAVRRHRFTFDATALEVSTDAVLVNEPGAPLRARWRLIVGFFVGNALFGVFDETVYQHGFGHALAVGLSGQDAAVLLGVVSAGLTIGMLFGGPLSDAVGRQIVLVGAALMTALSLLGFADASPIMIWGWGAAYGIGLGASIAVRSAAWGDAFQGPGRGRTVGIVASGYPVGAALTIWLGAVWLDGGGSFEVLALVGALAAALWAIVGGALTAPAPLRLGASEHLPPPIEAPSSSIPMPMPTARAAAILR